MKNKEAFFAKLAQNRKVSFKFMEETFHVQIGNQKEFQEFLKKYNDITVGDDAKLEMMTEFALSHIVDPDVKNQKVFTKEEFETHFSDRQAGEFLKLFMETYMPPTKVAEKN